MRKADRFLMSNENDTNNRHLKWKCFSESIRQIHSRPKKKHLADLRTNSMISHQTKRKYSFSVYILMIEYYNYVMHRAHYNRWKCRREAKRNTFSTGEVFQIEKCNFGREESVLTDTVNTWLILVTLQWYNRMLHVHSENSAKAETKGNRKRLFWLLIATASSFCLRLFTFIKVNKPQSKRCE